MPLQGDTSLRNIYHPWPQDGSGWTGSDAIKARVDGWELEVQPEGLAPHDITYKYADQYPVQAFFQASKPIYDKEGFAHLLERAITGDKLSIKALYLMVYNDPQHYSEFKDTVDELQKTYGD